MKNCISGSFFNGIAVNNASKSGFPAFLLLLVLSCKNRGAAQILTGSRSHTMPGQIITNTRTYKYDGCK